MILQKLKDLHEHLCWWQAKYELLKDDPNMCMINVEKQGKGYPKGIDDIISDKVNTLREEAGLANINQKIE